MNWFSKYLVAAVYMACWAGEGQIPHAPVVANYRILRQILRTILEII